MFSVGSLLRPHASVLPVLIRLRRVALISFSCLDPRSYLNIQNSCIHNIVAPQGAREAYKCLNILHEERDKIWTVDLFYVYEFLWRCLFTTSTLVRSFAQHAVYELYFYVRFKHGVISGQTWRGGDLGFYF